MIFYFFFSKEKMLYVMCGLPGSGKTTYVQNNLPNSYIIDGDSLKTSNNVVKKLKDCLKDSLKEPLKEENRKKIVVDATNTTIERRSELIKVAKEFNKQFNLKIYCIWITTDVKECVVRAKKRGETGKKVPPVAIYTANKRFIEPSLDEGFDEILKTKS